MNKNTHKLMKPIILVLSLIVINYFIYGMLGLVFNNLLPNNSFEKVQENKNDLKIFQWKTEGNVSLEKKGVFKGKNAIKMEHLSKDEYSNIHISLDVQQNKLYKAVIYAKTKNVVGNGYKVIINTYPGTKISEHIEGTTHWKKISLLFSSVQKNVDLYYSLHHAKGMVVFDNAGLYKSYNFGGINFVFGDTAAYSFIIILCISFIFIYYLNQNKISMILINRRELVMFCISWVFISIFSYFSYFILKNADYKAISLFATNGFYGENLIRHLTVWVIVVIFSVPIGFLINIKLFKTLDSDQIILLSLPVGIIASVAIFSYLLFFHITVNPYNWVMIIIGIFLLLIQYLITEIKEITKNQIINYKNIFYKLILPLIALIIISLKVNAHLTPLLVPPSFDPLSASQSSNLITIEKMYPLVHPFATSELLRINYPIGMSCLINFYSYICTYPIETTFVGLVGILILAFTLCVYVLGLTLSNKNKWFAFVCSLFVINRNLSNILHNGQYVETLAMISIMVAIFILLCSIDESDFKKAFFGGIIFGLAMIAHGTMYMFWFLAFSIFCITIFLSNEKMNFKKWIMLPIFISTSIMSSIPIWKNYLGWGFSSWKTELLHMREVMNTYVGWTICLIALYGIIYLVFSRKFSKLQILLLTYSLFAIIWIEQWRIVKILHPGTFKIFTLNTPDWMGATEQFASFSIFKLPGMMVFYGLIFVLPFMVAYGIEIITRIIDSILTLKIKKNINPLVSLPLIILLIVHEAPYVPNAPSQLMSIIDYKALTWMRDNIPKNSFILQNPSWSYSCHNNWVGVVSKRKTVYLYIYESINAFHVTGDRTIDFKATEYAFYNIENTESYDILKKYGITHLYIAANTFDTNQEYEKYLHSSILEKIYPFTVGEVYKINPYIFKVNI